MFPQNLNKADHKFDLIRHNAIYFNTKLAKEEVIDRIMKEGISKFVDPDFMEYEPYRYKYNDERISGLAAARGADCCSFTRNANFWYFFPIHKKELANVRIGEQELIEWINFLNQAGMGFEYLYLGEQPAPAYVRTHRNFKFLVNTERGDDFNYYWVGVPAFDPQNNKQNTSLSLKSYLHWMSLRYLINTNRSNNDIYLEVPNSKKLGYYMIPRITMYFFNELGLSRFKAFLYAHIMHPFYSSFSLFYSNHMGIDPYNGGEYQAPCLDITPEQFQEMMKIMPKDGLINKMFTRENYNFLKYNNKTLPLPVDNLEAPYDPHFIFKAFMDGDYDDAVAHIENSYKKSKENKKNAGKETINS